MGLFPGKTKAETQKGPTSSHSRLLAANEQVSSQ